MTSQKTTMHVILLVLLLVSVPVQIVMDGVLDICFKLKSPAVSEALKFFNPRHPEEGHPTTANRLSQKSKAKKGRRFARRLSENAETGEQKI